MRPQFSSLVWRVVIVAGVGALLGVPVVWALFLRTAIHVVVGNTIEFGRPVVEATGGLGCDAAPERFGFVLERGAIYAYDAATGRSANTTAPPLDPVLWARSSVEALAVRVLPDDSPGQLVYRRPQPGPCSLMFVAWAPAPVRADLRLVLAVMALVGCGVALLLAGVWILRPTLRRIATLAAATDDIGGAQAPAAVIAEGHDELAQVGQRVVAAHTRIVQAQAAIEAKNHALTQHLVQVTHDLRSPLTSLQLTLEDLQGSVEAARPWAGQAIDSALYIESLLDNLGIASRLREGLMTPHEQAPVELGALVDRVVARLRPLAQHRGVALVGSRPDQPVQVRWLGVLAERVISNLVDNAVRYAGQGRHVAVVLDVVPEGFELVVVDDGPGIDPAVLARLDAPWQSPDGHGLGLRITRALAAQAGLALTLGRDPDSGGTRATLRGPRLEARST